MAGEVQGGNELEGGHGGTNWEDGWEVNKEPPYWPGNKEGEMGRVGIGPGEKLKGERCQLRNCLMTKKHKG